MASNVFTIAKSIRKKHPRMDWQECVRKAGIEARKKNKPAKKRAIAKKKPAKKRAPTKRAATRVVKAKAKMKSLASIKSESLTGLYDKYGTLMQRHLKAKKVSDRKKIMKEVVAVRRSIAKISKL